MTSFDFISDDDFRSGLESDYAELLSVIEDSAYKAAHVLSGSIVEAILIDTLIASGNVPKKQGLTMDFATAIASAKEKGIISATTADLSSAIKSYRNLIHPGRSIRLNETPTAESAQVAKALVTIVAREVEGWKRKDYGYTAQQIVSKLQRDSSAGSIVPHILAEANQREVERLLLISLPDAYLRGMEAEDTPEYALHAYIQCFRTAFDLADEGLKKQVMTSYVKMLKEESDSTILPYELAFVRGHDLKYLANQDLRLVLDHLLGRMQRSVTLPLIEAFGGIGNYLSEADVNRFIDPLVRAVVHSKDIEIQRLARNCLVMEWMNMPSSVDIASKHRIDSWIALYKTRNQPAFAVTLSEVVAEMDVDNIFF